jgi:predicted regulator of Ras-like GTPase activity (Roadblock/LC7/MglB family)
LSYAYRQDLNWLVTDFTTRVADVAHAVVVSADGVPLALSEHIPHQFAEQLAAITSGLTSLMAGAARIFEAGQPTQALVEMDRGLMFVMAISDGSSLAVLAAPEGDTDLVAYEMSLLVEAVGDVLTPAARAQGLSRHATEPRRCHIAVVRTTTESHRRGSAARCAGAAV